MTTLIRTTCIVAALLAVAMPTVGQTGGRPACRGGGVYSSASEVTVSGTVESVSTTARTRSGGGLHLILRTDTGALEVDLGPSAFVTAQGFAFSKDDQVTVVGARTARAQRDVVIARQIDKGGKVLTLRDACGIPLWSRRGGRPS